MNIESRISALEALVPFMLTALAKVGPKSDKEKADLIDKLAAAPASTAQIGGMFLRTEPDRGLVPLFLAVASGDVELVAPGQWGLSAAGKERRARVAEEKRRQSEMEAKNRLRAGVTVSRHNHSAQTEFYGADLLACAAALGASPAAFDRVFMRIAVGWSCFGCGVRATTPDEFRALRHADNCPIAPPQ